MGAFLDRLRGRPRIEPTRVRAVWNGQINNHQDYMTKVLQNLIARDEGVKAVFMENKHHTQNEEEREFVLRLLATRIADFFHSITSEDVLRDSAELKRMCYTMGQQHSAYSKDAFKLIYWDEFTLAMLEELEQAGQVPKDDLRAWQTLLHLINENMLQGYEDARARMR